MARMESAVTRGGPVAFHHAVDHGLDTITGLRICAVFASETDANNHINSNGGTLTMLAIGDEYENMNGEHKKHDAPDDPLDDGRRHPRELRVPLPPGYVPPEE